MSKLLTRDEFKLQVLALHQGRCALCPNPADAAHHIMDRKLFVDGGYRWHNGAPVCAACHWRCETTEVDVETVLAASGHKLLLLPEGFDPAKRYDKWGNEILPDGYRRPGPLFQDDGARKALAKGGMLWRFNLYG